MGEITAIEWTDATQNFWRGCHKVSPGCAHCYMFDGQERYGNDPSVVVRAAPGTFNAPLTKKWRTNAAEILRTKGHRMRIFTCSWSDFFHEDADPWRDEAWDIIRRCPEYDWQILTKRTELVADRLPSDWGDGWPHVWLGTSIENRRFVGRADDLRATPAAVRFISAEPLLGPLVPDGAWDDDGDEAPYAVEFRRWRDDFEGPGLDLTGIDWLIVGGESGPDHRPMKSEWVRDLRDACLATHACDKCPFVGGCTTGGCPHGHRRTAFFFKQIGGRTPKSRGRTLDGRTWDEMPVTPRMAVKQ